MLSTFHVSTTSFSCVTLDGHPFEVPGLPCSTRSGSVDASLVGVAGGRAE
eukprot:m.45263 g.45263  ORF g.45263 m.45263 type:complete len:50 (-) comp8616_c0_seq2:1691-1840(-)